MKIFSNLNNAKIPNLLKEGRVGVMPTDTIYGVLGKAKDKEVVERIYKIKERNPQKPLIVLISSPADLKAFDIKDHVVFEKVWPGEVSIILSCDKLPHIDRGSKKVAFRVPRHDKLRKIIEKTGPLVAPSANKEGKAPAKTIKEAISYFADNVDFYVDEGKKGLVPSTLIEIKKNGRVDILREGRVKNKYLLKHQNSPE